MKSIQKSYTLEKFDFSGMSTKDVLVCLHRCEPALIHEKGQYSTSKKLEDEFKLTLLCYWAVLSVSLMSDLKVFPAAS